MRDVHTKRTFSSDFFAWALCGGVVGVDEVSVLIGGKAGDGINSAGALVARLFSRLGYRIYLYFDYPSLIKGGHNFAVVRATSRQVGAHRERVDFLLALDQETLRRHVAEVKPTTVVMGRSDRSQGAKVSVPVKEVLDRIGASDLMGNTCMVAAFARAAGVPWEILEEVIRAHITKETSLNIAVAREAYTGAIEVSPVPRAPGAAPPLPLLTGNEAIGLGLAASGLDLFIAYPMTPTSNLLHFLAEYATPLGLTVVHPENEIAVILMALGAAYAGKKAAVGTSGGGFCLMTEGFSLAGMAEIPVVVVMGQRAGPSTGLPTYSAQTELLFVLNAGHGEFPRLVVAPADVGEAYRWSALALQIAWDYQVPAVILVDKTLCEGSFSCGPDDLIQLPYVKPVSAGPKFPYLRYQNITDGVSPFIHPPDPLAVVKVNSYSHDEAGITSEDSGTATMMVEKRIRKGESLAEAVRSLPTVEVSGDPASRIGLICFGTMGGVCREVAEHLGIRCIRPVVLAPFPSAQVHAQIDGLTQVIAVEENATGQLAHLFAAHGIRVHHQIHRVDGRPFALEALIREVSGVIG